MPYINYEPQKQMLIVISEPSELHLVKKQQMPYNFMFL